MTERVQEPFNIGDKVWLLRKAAWGKVVAHENDKKYPIRVDYVDREGEITYLYFTDEGLEYESDGIPSIYHNKIVFETPKKPFKPTLVNEMVAVKVQYADYVVSNVVNETQDAIYLEGRGKLLKEDIVDISLLGPSVKF